MIPSKLPDTENLCGAARHHWNKAVFWRFSGLAELPKTLGTYSVDGYHYLAKQLESPEAPATPTTAEKSKKEKVKE